MMHEDDIKDLIREEKANEIANLLLNYLHSFSNDNALKYRALFRAFFLFSYPVFGEKNE